MALLSLCQLMPFTSGLFAFWKVLGRDGEGFRKAFLRNRTALLACGERMDPCESRPRGRGREAGAVRRRFRFVVAGALAVLSALLCVLYGQHVRAEAERVRSEALERYGGEVVTLAVAAVDLEPGDVVSRQNVTERDWLADLAPTEAVVALDSIMGREITVPAAAGVPLTAVNFRQDEESVEVPSGCVALSFPLTDKCSLPASAGVGTALVAYEVRDEGATVVASRLQVLRVAGEQGGVGSKLAVTVAVSPDEVTRVLTASAEGTLRLALPADDLSDLGVRQSVPTAPKNVAPEPSGAVAPEGAGVDGALGDSGSAEGAAEDEEVEP